MKMSMNLTEKEVAEIKEIIKDQNIGLNNDPDFRADPMDHKIHYKNKSIVMDYNHGTYDVEINEKFMIFIIRKSLSLYKICKNFVSIIKDFFKEFDYESDEFIGEDDIEIKIDDMDAEEFNRKCRRIKDSLDPNYKIKLRNDFVELVKLCNNDLIAYYTLGVLELKKTDTSKAARIFFNTDEILITCDDPNSKNTQISFSYTEDVISIYKQVIDFITKK